ncbi:MAG: hypothetical protein RLZZ237_998 [Pseudomonadota bacterium]|jgi:sporulation protein YlmC with PRC-barrel domain
MSYLDRDILGMYRNNDTGPGPALMGADTLLGDDVYNHSDEELGDIKEIMLDMRSGQIAYAVLSFGGMLGMGEKLFAVPWERLSLDTINKRFVLDVDKDQLKNAPGFDKNNWPDMASDAWNQQLEDFYGTGTRYGTGAGAGAQRMQQGRDLRGGASLQSGSGGNLQSGSGSRSSLSDEDDLDKRS